MSNSPPMNKNLQKLWYNHFKLSIPLVVLEGGSRSGKTYSVMEYLLNVGLGEKKVSIGVFREDQATCKTSVIADALGIMGSKYIGGDESGALLGTRWKYMKSELTLVSDTGSVIKFGGTNDAGKLHGPQWDMVFINECTEVSYTSFTQLQQRTSSLILLDFNPSVTQHWVFSRVINQGPEKCFYIHSTFRDNPYLSQHQVDRICAYEPTPENIEAGTADAWRWDVYGLGQRGKIEGAVYTNWGIRYDAWPDDLACKYFGYGLDYGFTDPTALVACGLYNMNIYIREIVYLPELPIAIDKNNPDRISLEALMHEKGVNKHDPVIADSASPERTAQLRSSGFNVLSVKKGPNSISNGISLCRQHRIYVHPESSNLITELEQYRFKPDGRGNFTEIPIDSSNHALDAMRYWGMHNLTMGKGLSDSHGKSWPKTKKAGKRVW